MKVAGMAREIFTYCRKAGDTAVWRDQKLETQPGGVGRAAAEAPVVGCLGDRLEIFL